MGVQQLVSLLLTPSTEHTFLPSLLGVVGLLLLSSPPPPIFDAMGLSQMLATLPEGQVQCNPETVAYCVWASGTSAKSDRTRKWNEPGVMQAGSANQANVSCSKILGTDGRLS